MAELSGAARATVGKSHVATKTDIQLTWIGLGVAVLVAACVLAWTARGVGRRPLYWVNKLTEHEGPSQDFAEHLARAEELLSAAVYLPVVYPDRTAPGITATMHRGFASGGYAVPDPNIKYGGGQTEAW